MELMRTVGLRLVLSSALCIAGVVAAGAANAKPLAAGGGRTSRSIEEASTSSIVVKDKTWACSGPVNLDSVSVTITNKTPVAILLRDGCTGTIGTISVVTNYADGVHVNGTAHDLKINGGTITCKGRGDGIHQDGIQAMSGARVTFSNLTINCPSGSNADFYVNWSGDPKVSQPSNILCVSCRLYGTQSSTAFVAKHSAQSGVKNSTLCPSRYYTYRKYSATAVDMGNSYPKTC
jgi:hypothetical protein